MNDAERDHLNYSTWDYIKWLTSSIISPLYNCKKSPEKTSKKDINNPPYPRKEKLLTEFLEPNEKYQCIVFDLEPDELLSEQDTFTLIDKYLRDYELGLISLEELDQVKKDIVSKVLPRNLSHDLVANNKIPSRKMNSWINPPALPKSPGQEIPSRSGSKEGEDPDRSCDILIQKVKPLITDCISSSLEDERVYHFEKLRETLAKQAKKPANFLGDYNPEEEKTTYQPKRCSSLKSAKKDDEYHDSGTKKVVRFADALGLDLSISKQIMDGDNPPILPESALSDLNIDRSLAYSTIGHKFFQLNFAQPCSSLDFYHRVIENKILLENVTVDNSRNGSIYGIVRVKSISFEKDVQVRITYNSWTTFQDVKASYVLNSHDGVTDKFSFMIIFPNTLVCGDKVEFAVTYQIPGGEKFWDNNNGLNYHIVCYAKQTLYSNDTENWMNIY